VKIPLGIGPPGSLRIFENNTRVLKQWINISDCSSCPECVPWYSALLNFRFATTVSVKAFRFLKWDPLKFIIVSEYCSNSVWRNSTSSLLFWRREQFYRSVLTTSGAPLKPIYQSYNNSTIDFEMMPLGSAVIL
jgi:hypothetical protein